MFGTFVNFKGFSIWIEPHWRTHRLPTDQDVAEDIYKSGWLGNPLMPAQPVAAAV